MPRYGTHLQYDIVDFYENVNDNVVLTIHDNIRDNEEELSSINDKISLLLKASWETYYDRDNICQIEQFAKFHDETKLLYDSDYIIFDLDERYVKSSDGQDYRNWIYESEIHHIYKKLIKNKKKIISVLNDSYISSGVALALLRNV
jgi:hypothetical protein